MYDSSFSSAASEEENEESYMQVLSIHRYLIHAEANKNEI
jgi:hypothetical protein